MTLTFPLNLFLAGQKAIAAQVNANFQMLASAIISNYNNIQTILTNYVKTDGSTPFTAEQIGIDPTDPQGLVTEHYLSLHVPSYGYIGGLEGNIDPANFQSNWVVKPGQCADSANQVIMSLTSAISKNLFNSWQAGTGNGGRAPGANLAPGTTYFVFAISDVNGANTDIGFDTSLTASSLLPYASTVSGIGYTQYRLIWVITTQPATYSLSGTVSINSTSTVTGTNTLFTQQCKTGNSIIIDSQTKTIQSIQSDTQLTVNTAFTVTASNLTAQLAETNAITPGIQSGNKFIYQSPFNDFPSALAPITETNLTLTIPSGINIIPQVISQIAVEGGGIYDLVVNSLLMPLNKIVAGISCNVDHGNNIVGAYSTWPDIVTNNSQININWNAGGNTRPVMIAYTNGYITQIRG